MKMYIIFAISFILLFTVMQTFSGVLLTMMYTPDIDAAWKSSENLPQEVIMKGSNGSFIFTSIIAFLSATIAYFIPKKLVSNK